MKREYISWLFLDFFFFFTPTVSFFFSLLLWHDLLLIGTIRKHFLHNWHGMLAQQPSWNVRKVDSECNLATFLFLHSFMVVCNTASAALIVAELTVHSCINEGTKALIKESHSSPEGETRSWKVAQPLAWHCKQACLFPLLKPLGNVSVFR